MISLFTVGVHESRAENASTVSISSPDPTDFPHLTAYLDVHDSEGAFVHGLSKQDVTLLENNLQVPANELKEQKPGVQFVVAISPGEPFFIRDSLGVSRYEYLQQGLLAGSWLDNQNSADDLSLLTFGGPQVTHTTDPSALQSSLEAYLPDDLGAVPNLEVLASALQVVTDPTTRPGMERAILFITPPQGSEISIGLQSIIASARKQNIHVYVWMVGSQEGFTSPEVDMLQNLANQTQGTFFAFSHDEPIPDLESLLEPLRYIYSLGYDSKITSAGSQQLAAQVKVGNEQITSDPKSFEVNLQAPVPVLLNLPAEIVRTYKQQPTTGINAVEANLTPSEEIVNIQVRFPDGYDRPLTLSRLYVDGIINTENAKSPYDQFVWDLRAYVQDGVHTLRVEAIDSLGITGSSGESSVSIIVPTTSQGMMVAFSQKRPLLLAIVILLSASILVLVLILGGRIRPKPRPGQIPYGVDPREKTRPAGYRAHVHQRKDTVAPAVKSPSKPSKHSTIRVKSWREKLPWFKSKNEPMPAIAYLLPLTDSDEVTLPEAFRIIADDTSLGSDPRQVDLVIADPSIEGLHARIHHESASFLLTDAGSVAGTWVNYNLVPQEGIRIENTDIIHLGLVGFRFHLDKAEPLRKIEVTQLEPDQ